MFNINIFITKLENYIENYFTILKSRLQKLHKLGDGLTHSALKKNITKVIRKILKYN
jgi:hypothetical protein